MNEEKKKYPNVSFIQTSLENVLRFRKRLTGFTTIYRQEYTQSSSHPPSLSRLLTLLFVPAFRPTDWLFLLFQNFFFTHSDIFFLRLIAGTILQFIEISLCVAAASHRSVYPSVRSCCLLIPYDIHRCERTRRTARPSVGLVFAFRFFLVSKPL